LSSFLFFLFRQNLRSAPLSRRQKLLNLPALEKPVISFPKIAQMQIRNSRPDQSQDLVPQLLEGPADNPVAPFTDLHGQPAALWIDLFELNLIGRKLPVFQLQSFLKAA
jgi:hypothetical protein